MKEYLVTVWEIWEYGRKWSYRVGTNNIEDLKQTLKQMYNRFTVEEIDDAKSTDRPDR